jgi:hypothetical protein
LLVILTALHNNQVVKNSLIDSEKAILCRRYFQGTVDDGGMNGIEIQPMLYEVLPFELWCEILQQLDWNSLLKVSGVCKKWRSVVFSLPRWMQFRDEYCMLIQLSKWQNITNPMEEEEPVLIRCNSIGFFAIANFRQQLWQDLCEVHRNRSIFTKQKALLILRNASNLAEDVDFVEEFLEFCPVENYRIRIINYIIHMETETFKMNEKLKRVVVALLDRPKSNYMTYFVSSCDSSVRLKREYFKILAEHPKFSLDLPMITSIECLIIILSSENALNCIEKKDQFLAVMRSLTLILKHKNARVVFQKVLQLVKKVPNARESLQKVVKEDLAVAQAFVREFPTETVVEIPSIALRTNNNQHCVCQ